jgi:hypothetical protein
VTRLTSFRFGRVQARETTKNWAALRSPLGTPISLSETDNTDIGSFA